VPAPVDAISQTETIEIMGFRINMDFMPIVLDYGQFGGEK
jgi:hypothetical protein